MLAFEYGKKPGLTLQLIVQDYSQLWLTFNTYSVHKRQHYKRCEDFFGDQYGLWRNEQMNRTERLDKQLKARRSIEEHLDQFQAQYNQTKIIVKFVAALIKMPLWIMNGVPFSEPDTLSVIFDRGLVGIYHDLCESFNTYSRIYNLLHASFLFGNLAQRCNILDVVVEVGRILIPGGILLVKDTRDLIKKLSPILHLLHWSGTLNHQQFIVGKKGFWCQGEKTRL